MKKISLLLVVSILVLNVVTISSLAAVQSDAEAGQWAKTYVFDDFNQRPTGKTVTYKPDGTPTWSGVDTTSPESGNLYRSINAVNDISSSNDSYNKSLVQHLYGWNTNTKGGKGMTGWFGSAAEGYYAFSDTSVTDGANGMEVLGSPSVTANMPYTPQSNLSVDWDKDTVEISYDYLWSGAQDGNNNTFMMRIYDTYYNKETKQYDSKGRTDRIISYMPQVRRLSSGNLQIKVFDGTTSVVATLDKDTALSLFNIDTSYKVTNAQWVHMTAVITKSDTTYTSKFYVNGRPLSGTVGNSTLSGSYNVTLADVTETNYEHKGISYYATAATPTIKNDRLPRQLFNGIDNIRFVKYNSSTTMPSEMTIDSDTSNIVIPFINNYYNSSLPDGVKAAAVDLSSFTIQATKNGVDISSEITPDYAKATRTSDSTRNQMKDTYITQDGKSLKLKGITSNPGDTIVIKLNGIKDVTGKALTNGTITLTNPAKVSVSDFKIDENGKATATVKNNAVSEQKCIFVIGDYKDAATLIAANISDVTLQAGESKNIEVSITKADGHSSYKAFIWDKTDLTPYADSIEK